MKYYSEVLKKMYDNQNDLVAAEEKALESQAREKQEKEQRAIARKSDADKVEAARKELVKAQQTYRDQLNSFCSKWGTYHTSFDTKNIPTLFDIFGLF